MAISEKGPRIITVEQQGDITTCRFHPALSGALKETVMLCFTENPIGGASGESLTFRVPPKRGIEMGKDFKDQLECFGEKVILVAPEKPSTKE
jgi:hypothetical protein